MITEQRHWDENKGWVSKSIKADLKDAQLVLVFGSPQHMQNKSLFDEIRQSYPQAYIFKG
jgi:hypothetical protein